MRGRLLVRNVSSADNPHATLQYHAGAYNATEVAAPLAQRWVWVVGIPLRRLRVCMGDDRRHNDLLTQPLFCLNGASVVNPSRRATAATPAMGRNAPGRLCQGPRRLRCVTGRQSRCPTMRSQSPMPVEPLMVNRERLPKTSRTRANKNKCADEADYKNNASPQHKVLPALRHYPGTPPPPH